MAESASFAVVLEDQTSGAAASASAALGSMRTAIQTDMDAMKGLQTAMRNLKGPGAENSATYQQLQTELTATKARIQSTTEAFVQAGGTFNATASATKNMTDATGKLDESTKKALGPLGEKYERLNALKGMLGTSGLAAAGFAAAVVAMAAVVVAAVAAIAQLVLQMAEFALASSDAAIKSQIMLENVTGSTAAAGQLGSAVSSVASKVPLAASEVQKLATEIYKTGKRGKELEIALEKASLKAAGLDNVSPKALAARMANLDTQALKFKEHIAAVFSGPTTQEAVMRFEGALKSVADLFDTSTESGHALQVLVSTMLDPLFDAASAAAPYVKQLFKGMVVGALLVTIGVLQLKKVFTDTFGSIDTSGIDGMNIAFYAGIVVVGLIVVALGVLAVAAAFVAIAFTIAAAAVFLFMLPFMIGAAVIVVACLLIVAAIAGIGYIIYQAVSWLADIGSAGVDAAGNLIDGLVGGITTGAGAVYDAIKGMASGVVSTLMDALQMHSPSVLFANLGDVGIAGGLAQGVDKGGARVNAAVGEMVAIPSAVAAPARAQGSSSGGHVFNIVVNAASGAAADITEAVREGVIQALQESGDMAGAPA